MKNTGIKWNIFLFPVKIQLKSTSSFFTAAILVLLITSCAARSPIAVNAEERWHSHKIALMELKVWQTRGRVGVIAGDESWSAAFDWQQQQAEYWIRISGPFGRSIIELEGKPRYVLLKSGGKDAQVAQNAEMLLKWQTGWSLPVEGLRYWIVGLPVPNLPERHTIDSQGHLSSLNQSGWQIEYQSYQQVDGYRLPKKLHMVNRDVRVKLIAREWRVNEHRRKCHNAAIGQKTIFRGAP